MGAGATTSIASDNEARRGHRRGSVGEPRRVGATQACRNNDGQGRDQGKPQGMWDEGMGAQTSPPYWSADVRDVGNGTFQSRPM
eukprot:9498356-Pyramimonas_sp.AAC.1